MRARQQRKTEARMQQFLQLLQFCLRGFARLRNDHRKARHDLDVVRLAPAGERARFHVGIEGLRALDRVMGAEDDLGGLAPQAGVRLPTGQPRR